MKIEVKIPQASIQALQRTCQNVLQIAAQKAYETAVERTLAAGQGPYSTGQLRQSLRVQKTDDYEYTIFCPMYYGVYNEFGTGPRGKATGAWPEFASLDGVVDPYSGINYHGGEVLVTRWRGRILDEPYIRHTQGMEAQPFMRPALVEGYKWLEKLLKQYLK